MSKRTCIIAIGTFLGSFYHDLNTNKLKIRQQSVILGIQECYYTPIQHWKQASNTTLIAIHALLKTSIWMLICLFISLQKAAEKCDMCSFQWGWWCPPP
ncbi:unnamed protein product, partial [Vitis vinifera]